MLFLKNCALLGSYKTMNGNKQRALQHAGLLGI